MGWRGKRFDEGKLREIVIRVGLDAVSRIGGTPLTVAADWRREGMVRWLLEQGADVEEVAPHENFRTALRAAAYAKRLEAAALLIAVGAKVEACGGSRNTPLANTFINCFADPLPLATLLIENGEVDTGRVCKSGEIRDAPAFPALRRVANRIHRRALDRTHPRPNPTDPQVTCEF